MSAPVVVYCLDDEAESGADAVDVLAHYLFDNRGFARIVEAPVLVSAMRLELERIGRPYSIKMRSSLSLSRALRRIDNMFAVGSVIEWMETQTPKPITSRALC